MVGSVVPKQRLESIVPPTRRGSKAAPVTKGVADSTKKVGEVVGLADLRDVDKAKVARLINHVMMSFKEIQRLKELLELERSTQAALVAKLQQQNQEVAAEVSQLRLKLASLQLLSSPSPKVDLHAGRRSSLSPIKEAECSEAESEVTPNQALESNAEKKSILTNRNKDDKDLTVTGGEDKCMSNESEEGPKHYDENVQTGECEASLFQTNDSKFRGKENKDPATLVHATGDTQTTNEGDATVPRKRPPPRPLPDLLSNILHRSKDFGAVRSADESTSSVKCFPNVDDSSGSRPVLNGKLKPTLTQAHPQLYQGARSSSSLDVESVQQSTTVGTSSGQARDELSVDMCGDRLGCTYDVTFPQTAVCPLATLQGKPRIDLGGQSTRLEAEGKAGLGCEQSGGGTPCESLNCVLQKDSKCAAIHQCRSSCQQDQSSNLTNAFCPESLDGPEKAHNECCTLQNLNDGDKSTSKQKLRFDPTAGEEGVFYYVPDIEEKVIGRRPGPESFRPGMPGETQGLQVEEERGQENQRLLKETLESHWAPEAIERRNSFDKIPVTSPKSMKDNEEHAYEQNRGFPERFRNEIVENGAGSEARSTGEEERLATPGSEVINIRNEKSHLTEPRRSLQQTTKCVNCSSLVPQRHRKAPLSSDKHCGKYQSSCSKCSSIVKPKFATHRLRVSETCLGSTKTSKNFSSKAMPYRQQLDSPVETHVCGAEKDVQGSNPSIVSSCVNMARCTKCTARLERRLVRPVLHEPMTGAVRVSSDSPLDGEESNPGSTSKDMYMSTDSSADDSVKAGRHVPSFPMKACRNDIRKAKKKRVRQRVTASVKLLSDQRSEPIRELYQHNHEMVEILPKSNGNCTGQLKVPLADSAECRKESRKLGKSHKRSCKESTEKVFEERSKASCGIARHGHGNSHSDLDKRRGFTLNCESRHLERPYEQSEGRKQNLEKWKRFEVDDLLERFIQSNAECAAELVKCSTYFGSTSSRPSSQSTLPSGNASENCIASKLPLQTSLAAEQGIESMVSPERVKQRIEPLPIDHSGCVSAQPYLENCTRCSICGGFSRTGPFMPSGGSIEMLETPDLRDLCHACSASGAPEEAKAGRRSAGHGANRLPAAPPIVLPKNNADNAFKLYEAESRLKPPVDPSSSEILICNVANPEDWASGALQDLRDHCREDLRMPIITRVSVSSRRSTPPREIENVETAKELTKIFDMSLYDLVNDLEGQRRDYWRRVNSNTMDERAQYGKGDTNRRRMVDVVKVHRPSTTRRLPSRKLVHANHFR